MGRTIAWLVLVAMMGGCGPMASIAWSPDGKRAVYAVQGGDPHDPVAAAWLIDDAGRTVADLGDVYAGLPAYGSLGPAAWDGNAALYLVAPGGTDDLTPLAGDLGGPASPSTRPADGGDSPVHVRPATLYRWADGRRRPLASLGRRFPIDVQRSPDGRWVAVLTTPTDPQRTGEDRSELYACDVTAGKLYRVSATAGYGLCFTGPARLAFVHRSGGPAGRGEVAEVDLADVPLDDSRRVAIPGTGIKVLADEAGWLRPAADGGLCFLARPSTFPSAHADPPGPMLVGSVYHWDRHTRAIRELARSDVAFAVSPDGRQLLAVTVVPGPDGRVRAGTAIVLNADGTGARPLGPPAVAAFGLWPTWHGDGRVTRAAGAPAAVHNPGDAGERQAFDLIDEPVDGGGDDTRKLSDRWPDVQRPSWTDPWQLQDIHG